MIPRCGVRRGTLVLLRMGGGRCAPKIFGLGYRGSIAIIRTRILDRGYEFASDSSHQGSMPTRTSLNRNHAVHAFVKAKRESSVQ